MICARVVMGSKFLGVCEIDELDIVGNKPLFQVANVFFERFGLVALVQVPLAFVSDEDQVGLGALGFVNDQRKKGDPNT